MAEELLVKYNLNHQFPEWVLIQLIAKRTEVVAKLIFYPFIIWFIMLISRIKFIDNWQTPIGLAIVFTISALLVWVCAFLLRKSAEDARTGILRRLKEQVAKYRFEEKPDQERLNRFEFAIREISDIKSGAFLPLMQHSVVHALFVPFGGISGAYILDFLAKSN